MKLKWPGLEKDQAIFYNKQMKVEDLLNLIKENASIYTVKSKWYELNESEKIQARKMIRQDDSQDSTTFKLGLKVADKSLYSEIYEGEIVEMDGLDKLISSLEKSDIFKHRDSLNKVLVEGYKEICKTSKSIDDIKTGYFIDFLKGKSEILDNYKIELESKGFSESEILLLLKEASENIKPSINFMENQNRR